MADILKPLGTFKFWKELVTMTLGMLIGAAAVYYFLIPSKLIIGSISGLSIVISELLLKIGLTVKVSWIVTAINAILLVMAWFLIGHEFGAKTVYTALILGPLMDFWEAVLPYDKLGLVPGESFMGDPWLDLLCFILMLSIAQAILVRINASTGGLDILAKMVNKYFHFDIGMSVTIAGAIICCTAFAINPFRLVILGLIGTWLNGITVDYFTASLNRRKRVCIVTGDWDKVREYIVVKLKRGCSIYDMEGGYSGEKHREIQTLLTQDEFADLMNYMQNNNINSFTTAGNVSEIYGMWRERH